jgi:hypothetical protein
MRLIILGGAPHVRACVRKVHTCTAMQRDALADALKLTAPHAALRGSRAWHAHC